MNILNKTFTFKELFMAPAKMSNGGMAIQAKADEINDFGKTVKNRSVNSIAKEYIRIRSGEQNLYGDPYAMTSKDADVVLRKYGKYEEVHDKVDKLDEKYAKEDREFVDPAGGSGLHSHI